MSKPHQKRKHYTLSIKDKNKIIERLDRGETYTKLADEYGIGRATIYCIKKNRAKIQAFVLTSNKESANRRTMKTARHPEVDDAVYAWYLKESQHTHVTGPMLTAQAKAIYKQLTNKHDFTASTGWLDRFKTRHGIQFSTTDEVRQDLCVEEFKMKLKQKVKELDLSPSQVYNADEAGLCWRVLSKRTVDLTDDCGYRKPCEDKITFLACANASGLHRLKLLIIGKLKKPRVFKNVDLPVNYYTQENAIITKELFTKWFHECFVPEMTTWLENQNLPPKALLLLDHAVYHPTDMELISCNNNIAVMFFPPNYTSLQPLEQNIIESMKQHYKKNMLLTSVFKDQSAEKTLSNYNMKNMTFDLTDSWTTISSSRIVSSWKNLWPNIMETLTCAEDDMNLNLPFNSEILELVSNETKIRVEDLKNWCDGLKEEDVENVDQPTAIEVPIEYDTRDGSNCMSLEFVKVSEQDEDEEDCEETVACISSDDAVKNFDVCLQWAEENGCTTAEIEQLRLLRDKAFSHIKKEINND